jgi:hypothetical protein
MVSFSTCLKQQSVLLRLRLDDEVVAPPSEPVPPSFEEDQEVSMSFLAILLRCLSALNV